MIKIIKKGYVPKIVIPHYSIICKNCNTIFECDKTDTRFKMVGHGEGTLYINCPVCGTENRDFMNPNWTTLNLKEIREEV